MPSRTTTRQGPTSPPAAPPGPVAREARSAGVVSSLMRRAVLGRLGDLRGARLVMEESGKLWAFGDGDEADGEGGLVARVRVNDPAAWTAVALRGSVGAGEAYARGEWDTENLTAVARVFARNRDVLDGLEGGIARLARPALRACHALRSNTRRGSRRNISAHYDLGNEFFERMLDDTMLYSAGLYTSPSSSLEDASVAKLDRLCRKLALDKGDHLLEIGSGWGAMAVHAARAYGCRVTTTTISSAQLEVARARVAEAGLEDRVEVLFRDYRELEGTYDKLVSIEMIEAVGWRYYPEFFRAVSRLLAPHGRAAIQAIAIPDQVYERAKRSVDFIQRHIFPGSCIPSTSALLQAMREHTDLWLENLEDLTPHYARTLRDWRENLARSAAEVRRFGYDETFSRLWDFYLCYCEGGFEERAIRSVQYVFTKPGDRSAPFLPGV